MKSLAHNKWLYKCIILYAKAQRINVKYCKYGISKREYAIMIFEGDAILNYKFGNRYFRI